MKNDGMEESSSGDDDPNEVVNIRVSSKVAVPVKNSMPNLVATGVPMGQIGNDGTVVYAE